MGDGVAASEGQRLGLLGLRVPGLSVLGLRILDKERRGKEQGKSGRQQERTTHESTLLVRRRALPTPVAA